MYLFTSLLFFFSLAMYRSSSLFISSGFFSTILKAEGGSLISPGSVSCTAFDAIAWFLNVLSTTSENIQEPSFHTTLFCVEAFLDRIVIRQIEDGEPPDLVRPEIEQVYTAEGVPSLEPYLVVLEFDVCLLLLYFTVEYVLPQRWKSGVSPSLRGQKERTTRTREKGDEGLHEREGADAGGPHDDDLVAPYHDYDLDEYGNEERKGEYEVEIIRDYEGEICQAEEKL